MTPPPRLIFDISSLQQPGNHHASVSTLSDTFWNQLMYCDWTFFTVQQILNLQASTRKYSVVNAHLPFLVLRNFGMITFQGPTSPTIQCLRQWTKLEVWLNEWLRAQLRFSLLWQRCFFNVLGYLLNFLLWFWWCIFFFYNNFYFIFIQLWHATEVSFLVGFPLFLFIGVNQCWFTQFLCDSSAFPCFAVWQLPDMQKK